MLVLDANILIRAVLGSRVLGLLRRYAAQVEFMAPDVVFQEAQEHLPGILEVRGIPVAPAMATLDLWQGLAQTVDAETHASFESIARERIGLRDEDDWPVLAAALALGCPIWTEDTDFFGCGVATWTRIEWSCTWRRTRSETNEGKEFAAVRPGAQGNHNRRRIIGNQETKLHERLGSPGFVISRSPVRARRVAPAFNSLQRPYLTCPAQSNS